MQQSPRVGQIDASVVRTLQGSDNDQVSTEGVQQGVRWAWQLWVHSQHLQSLQLAQALQASKAAPPAVPPGGTV